MTHKMSLLIGGGALAALALSGCHDSQPSTPPTTTTTTVNTTPGPAVPGSGVTSSTTTTAPGTPPVSQINNNAGAGSAGGTDTTTASAVSAAIMRNVEMTGSRVNVVVDEGVARLNGTVQNQQQKALAVTTARKTAGVTSVVDKLMIDATGGVHSAATPPKVVNHTIVINHYMPPMSGGSTGNGMNSSKDTGNGSGMSSGGNGTGTGTNGGNGMNSGKDMDNGSGSNSSGSNSAAPSSHGSTGDTTSSGGE